MTLLAIGCGGDGGAESSGGGLGTEGTFSSTGSSSGRMTSTGSGETGSVGEVGNDATTSTTSGGAPLFDVGTQPDLGTACTPGSPNCPEFCDPKFEAEEFVDPVLKCSWTTQATIITPVVADLEGDGDIEIVSVDFAGALVILEGSDCSEVFHGSSGTFGTRGQLAVADLDEDGDLEIIGTGTSGNYGNNTLRAVDHLGNTIAISAAASVSGSNFNDGGAAIANLDGVGLPEIAYGGMAVRLEGGSFTTLFNNPVGSGHWGIMTAVSDVDLDGVPELVVGNRIFDGETGADETPPGIASVPAGYVAIGDFDTATPEPEVVLISSQSGSPSEIRIYHPITGNLVLGPINFGTQWGGPPTVGDFDGDGEAEVAVAGFDAYHVFDLECLANPLPADCEAAGIRWRQPSQDFSSGSTGSTLFDFNGDGRVEVVYRDEQILRIYDGPTGQVLSQYPISSGTILENPVVADVDLDGHAEIVVPGHGGTPGIFVLEDPRDLWVEARSLWNQHTYHVTNISEDGTVPANETRNWDSWNNFRQNVGPNPEGGAPCIPMPEG